MGNTWSCFRQSKEEVVSGAGKGGMVECGDDETAAPTLGGECGSSSNHALERCDGTEVAEVPTRSGKVRSDVEERIEQSKVHWSALTKRELDVDDEEVAQENKQVFEELQSHPSWGHFFKTYGYDTYWQRHGELVVGDKFAEGGQADIFHAKVIWKDPKKIERDLVKGREWVLKVFKKGTRLHELQAQWPLGYLQWYAQNLDRNKRGLPPTIRFRCAVHCGTLLEDGRFAFLMVKEHEDLRSQINRAMLDTGDGQGPFSKDKVERAMFKIALGMDWLHNHDIVHRDLKASNVLVHEEDGLHPWYYVADYECSVGVVGTGFFMAPEILQVIKDKVVNKNPKVFSKEADVYSYGMTCYEVLTGKLPFEGHPRNDYDSVIRGERPGIPEYVDSWIKELLSRCWDADCAKRPLFPEIIEILSSNSAVVRETQLSIQKREEDETRIFEERLLQQG